MQANPYCKCEKSKNCQKKIKSKVSKQQKKNKGFSDKTLKKIIVTMHDLNGNHTYHIQILCNCHISCFQS